MSEADDVVAMLERVRALGPNGDAKLIGALSVLAPQTLLMAIKRVEAHEAAKERAVAQAKADAHTALTRVMKAKAEVQKQMRAEDPFDLRSSPDRER